MNINSTQNGQRIPVAGTSPNKPIPMNQTAEYAKHAACVAIGALILGPLSVVTAGGACLGILLTHDKVTENAVGPLFKAWVNGEKTLGQCWNQLNQNEKIQVVGSLAIAALVTATFAAGGAALMIVATPLPVVIAVTAAVTGALGLATGAMIGHRMYRAVHNS